MYEIQKNMHLHLAYEHIERQFSPRNPSPGNNENALGNTCYAIQEILCRDAPANSSTDSDDDHIKALPEPELRPLNIDDPVFR
ncbi:9612_t:CDS:2 [Funneliformis geosporum]|uniref:9612_t:CDS:1 n=1 Tax=Funneliformis geosporum TaxID=1117311 RepID=A0A9W4SHC7_9GLOM|nr:9612_t:CDS:2 [Funneliformis geosporum]